MAGFQVREFVGEYRIGDIIGSGSHSQVRLAVHLPSKRPVAVKILDMAQPLVQQQAIREASILKEIGTHRNIIKLEGQITEGNNLYLFLEYASGGDLYSYLQKKGPLEESVVRHLCRQIVESLWYCQSRSITHHDIKLENILISADQTLRLSDFGLACKIGPQEFITFFGGSPLYMAPEVFSQLPHNSQADVWSFAVCLYYMVYGTYPFVASCYEDLEELILFDEVSFPSAYVSDDLSDLLRKMLVKDPSKRLTIGEIRKHRWWGESRPASTPRGLVAASTSMAVCS